MERFKQLKKDGHQQEWTVRKIQSRRSSIETLHTRGPSTTLYWYDLILLKTVVPRTL